MARLSIVNPIAEARQETERAVRIPPARRARTLEGSTIGLFWNGKQQGDHGLKATRDSLQKVFPSARFKEYLGDWGTNLRHSSPEQFEQIVSECDAMVGATAD
jgi:hypothetical protein